MNSLTMTAAAELAPRIRVNGVAPGATPTDLQETLRVGGGAKLR